MADKLIKDLTAIPSVEPSDILPIWDTSAGATRRATVGQVQGAYATLGANTFTAEQAIAGTERALYLVNGDSGAGTGRYIQIGRNSNASTPAAGSVQFIMRTGAGRYVWVDGSGNLRIDSVQPTNATDAGGTVVGAQTSHEAFKERTGEASPIAAVLEALAGASEHVARFRYRADADAYGESAQDYEGLILQEAAPATWRYGTDKHTEGFGAGKSLNEITLLGDLLRAVVHLAKRVAALEGAA